MFAAMIVEIRSVTHGVGTYRTEFDHLQELVGRGADRIVEESRRARQRSLVDLSPCSCRGQGCSGARKPPRSTAGRCEGQVSLFTCFLPIEQGSRLRHPPGRQ